MKYTVQSYVGEDREFIIHIFYWCIPLDMKSILNVKKNI